MNAIQFTDMAMQGLDAGLQAVMDRQWEQQWERAMQRQQAEMAAWQQYAGSLERKNAQLAPQVSILQKDYENIKDILKNRQSGYMKYTSLLVTRIEKLDDALQCQTANEFAYNRMCEKLVLQLRQSADGDTTGLASDEERVKQLQEDWKYFMEHKDVRMGVPPIEDAFKK